MNKKNFGRFLENPFRKNPEGISETSFDDEKLLNYSPDKFRKKSMQDFLRAFFVKFMEESSLVKFLNESLGKLLKPSLTEIFE